MKKEQYRNVILLLLGSIILNACAVKKSISLVPKSSQSVGVANPQSIIQKGKLNQFFSSVLVKDAQRKARKDAQNIAQLLNDISQNPAITGLTAKQDIFMFTLTQKNKKINCLAFGIKDKQKFTKLVKRLSEQGRLEKTKGYQRFIVPGEYGLGWDHKRGVLVLYPNSKYYINLGDKIHYLMKLKKKNQLQNEKKFQAFLANRKDISWWVASYILEEQLNRKAFKEGTPPKSEKYVQTHLDFQDNQVSFKVKVDLDEDIQKLLNEYKLENAPSSLQSLLKYFPKKNLGLASLSVNLSPYLQNERLQKLLEDTPDKKLERMVGLKTKKFLEQLGGSLIISFLDVDQETVSYYDKKWDEDQEEYVIDSIPKTKEVSIPRIAVSVSIKNNAFMKRLMKSIPQEGITYQDNYFKLNSGKQTFYLAYNQEAVYFTNHLESIQKFNQGGYSEHLGKSSLQSTLMNSLFFVSLNINLDDYPPIVQKEIRNPKQDTDDFWEVWNKFAKTLEFSYLTQDSFQMALKMTQVEGNSLFNILSTIKDYYELSQKK